MPIVKIVFCLIFTFLLCSCSEKSSEKNVTTIGIIIPIEHEALNEIIFGFESKLKELYKKPLEFKVANAENDQNLMHSLIQQMQDRNINLVVPIATTTLQMTLSIIKTKPVIGLAAMYTDAQRKVRQPCNVAIVNDELGIEQQIIFLHALYPNLRKIALIHSTNDKIFSEVKETKNVVQKYNLGLQDLMIQNLQELYSAANSLANDVDVIFILKDSMIVSGIETLIKVAKERKIPLITSDDASVKKGALLALGIHEREIGEAGAKLAAEILAGKKACDLPISKLTRPTVFVNAKYADYYDQSKIIPQVESTAKKFGYSVENESEVQK